MFLYVYSREALEKGKTHDQLWNGAQVCSLCILSMSLSYELCLYKQLSKYVYTCTVARRLRRERHTTKYGTVSRYVAYACLNKGMCLYTLN